MGDVFYAFDIDLVKHGGVSGPIAIESCEMKNNITTADELIDSFEVKQITIDRIIRTL